jgi:hypothetical protein
MAGRVNRGATPLVVPPLVRWAVALIAGVAVVHWLARQARRVNAELDGAERAPAVDPLRRRRLPTLRRDPRTGDWRVT